MKRCGAILRSVFAGPEFLIMVVGVALLMFWPNPLTWLSGRIGSQAELLKYVGLLPAGLVVYDATLAKSMLLPEADKQRILQSWELHWEFKCAVVVGLVYGFFFAIAGCAALLFDWKTPAAHQSAFLITSLAGGLAVSVTMYFAQIRIEELFRQHSTKPSAE
jgi:hypothetical protein